MTPKNYELATPIIPEKLLNAGFEPRDPVTYIFKKTLCKYSNNNIPFVLLKITILSNRLSYVVTRLDGSTYAPFYNPDQQHHNLVYDSVVKEFNKVMDGLVKKGVLIHKRKLKYGKRRSNKS
jgi:hypothetical protein